MVSASEWAQAKRNLDLVKQEINRMEENPRVDLSVIMSLTKLHAICDTLIRVLDGRKNV